MIRDDDTQFNIGDRVKCKCGDYSFASKEVVYGIITQAKLTNNHWWIIVKDDEKEQNHCFYQHPNYDDTIEKI